MQVNETWKPVPGFEGIYDVSDMGRVRSYKSPGCHKVKLRETPRIMSAGATRYRKSVGLSGLDGEKSKTFSVPRLVMLAFAGPRPPKHEVAHLNGDFHDNRLENLKYCTHKENESHKVAHGTSPRGENCGTAVLESWEAAIIRDLFKRGKSSTQLAKLFGISKSHVCAIGNGGAWAHLPPADLAWCLARIEKLNEALAEISGGYGTDNFEPCNNARDASEIAFRALSELESES